MYRFFLNEKKEKFVITDKIDIEHAIKVLRLKENVEVEVVYNEKEEYIGVIEKISKVEIQISEKERIFVNRETPYNIKVYQGIPKLQKIEIIAQNITQSGVKELIPVLFNRCVKNEIKNNQFDRINKIIKESAMQSKRLIIPKLSEVLKMETLLLELKKNFLNIIFYEEENKLTIKDVLIDINKNELENKNIGILIGPEGGFSEEEVDMLKSIGAKCVTMGNRIFRTEIAATSAINMINYELEL